MFKMCTFVTTRTALRIVSRNIRNFSCVHLGNYSTCNILPVNQYFHAENKLRWLSSSRCNFSTKGAASRGTDIAKTAIPQLEIQTRGETKSSTQGEKLGIFARFKLMYKQYWYVLIPVHIITSIGWFGGFYYLSKSGVDIPSLLQALHVSESIIEKVKDSAMGHFAIAYLCYKIATPARYAVTLGGTTVSIKYLVQAGWIKPAPTKTQLMQFYENKKAYRLKRKQDKDDNY